jgi:hypothetical protein
LGCHGMPWETHVLGKSCWHFLILFVRNAFMFSESSVSAALQCKWGLHILFSWHVPPKTFLVGE